MQTYRVTLISEPSASFRCQKAAGSVDLDLTKKLKHELTIQADIERDFNVGLIIGASGSGKTTLATQIYAAAALHDDVDQTKPIIEQFPASMSYDDCVDALNSIGLSQVVCWVRPVATLSNGQKARAAVALKLAKALQGETIVIDEWTSVVDRTVAKAMSLCAARHARKHNKRLVLLSCHYDVTEWLNPDWIIDCNTHEYFDRRLLCQGFERTERLNFEVRRLTNGSSWRMFSKYHYLSEKLPGGFNQFFGLFHDGRQIGFQAFSEYVPWGDKSKKRIVHMNRIVIHPDYVGFGLGMKFINEISAIVSQECRVMSKFSSVPIFRAMKKDPRWAFKKSGVMMAVGGGNMERRTSFRTKVQWWSFEYVGCKAG